MAIPRTSPPTIYEDDAEPLLSAVNRAAPPVVTPPTSTFTAGPLAPQKFDPVALQAALANFKLPTAPATPVKAAAPVTPAPTPPVAKAPAPVGAPTTWSTVPVDLAKYGLTQKDVNDASLLVPYKAPTPSPAPIAPSAAAPVATPTTPPPAVVAPAPTAAKPLVPFDTYLAEITKSAPQYDRGNPFYPNPDPTGKQKYDAFVQNKISEYDKAFANQLADKNFVPSLKEYLQYKERQFIPAETGGGSGLSAKTYSTYNPAADIATYRRVYGSKVNPWDIAYAAQPGVAKFSYRNESEDNINAGTLNFANLNQRPPKTILELQQDFLKYDSKLKPDNYKKYYPQFATYEDYLKDYNAKHEALPDNLKYISDLQRQLQGVANDYGFQWGTKGVKGQTHTYNIANLLAKSDVKSIDDLEWRTVNGKDKLFNKATGKPVDMHKDDDRNPKQLGWTAEGPGRVNYMVEKDANGKPVIVPAWKSNAPGGIAGTLLKIAPVALSFVPGVGPALSAAAAGVSTAIQGGDIGDILKSAGTSYLGGQVGGYAGDLAKGATQGMAPGISGALTGAASGGASSATTGLLRGDLNLRNVATGALTGGATGGISELVNTYLPPKGTLYEQNIAPGSTPAPVSGSTTVDNIIRNTAINTPGTLIRGGNITDALINAAIGETVKTATSAIPKTDNDIVDRVIAGTAGQYLGNELRDLAGSGSGGGRTVATNTTGTTTTTGTNTGTNNTGTTTSTGTDTGTTGGGTTDSGTTDSGTTATASTDYSDIVPMLLALGLMDSGDQSAIQPAPQQMAQMPTFDVGSMFMSSYLGNQNRQPQSVAELLQSLRTG